MLEAAQAFNACVGAVREPGKNGNQPYGTLSHMRPSELVPARPPSAVFSLVTDA